MALAGGLLMGFAVAGTAIVAFVHQRTAERIAANEAAATRALIHEIVPAGSYDNDVVTDTVTITAPEALGSDDPLPVYRARRDGQPVAAVMTVVAPDGYNGAIKLLVGVRDNGTVAGVRVVRHQETPGLGDGIEAARSDWITQFRGRSLQRPQPRQWRVAKDGGTFDQLTGATITSRAVVRAVREALVYFRSHRQALFARKRTD
ncbi:electron transport complex subunit RsxG [Ectothiorhodospiraceae bacterium WFHF3C12]|nr:electron transport complex subunit RsxG [Ectothiorhodospiraceae bacterium WFHF3C12]